MNKLLLCVLLGWALTCGLGSGFAQAASNTVSGKTSWAEANGVSLRYELTGAGNNTLVLLHEMCMSLETWDLIMPELIKAHRVLRYDLRGFGLSEKIFGAVTFDNHVEDLRALLDALNIKGKVTLVGGAMGGAICLAFAATYPERVNGVVAMSPAAGVTAQRRAPIMAEAARTDRSAMRAILDEQLIDIYPLSIRADEKRTAWFRGMQLATDPNSLAACLRMIAITDFSDYFKKITAPTLIIAAGLYPARPVESMQQMAQSIKGAKLEVLQTGHFIAAQSPEMLIPVLQRFFAQLPR
jgi:3-oxoadipate enol-lactonase